MRGPFAFLTVAVLVTVCSWAAKFSTIYKVGNDNKWEMSNFWNKRTFYVVPGTGQSECVALFPGIFEGKVITSDVVVTLHVATWGDGAKPKANTFSLFSDPECKKPVLLPFRFSPDSVKFPVWPAWRRSSPGILPPADTPAQDW